MRMASSRHVEALSEKPRKRVLDLSTAEALLPPDGQEQPAAWAHKTAERLVDYLRSV